MTQEGFQQNMEVNGDGRAMSLGSLLSKVRRGTLKCYIHRKWAVPTPICYRRLSLVINEPGQLENE